MLPGSMALCWANSPAPLPRRLKHQRFAAPKHGLGVGGKAAIGLVQHQAGREARRGGDLLARAHQDATRRLTRAGPERKYHHLPGPAADLRQQRIDAVGAMDEGHAALLAHHDEGEAYPVAEPGLAL